MSLSRTLSGRSHCMVPKVSISARELTVITNWSKSNAELFIQSILYTRRFYITCIIKKKIITNRKKPLRKVCPEGRKDKINLIFMLACVAWRFWLGELSNNGGRGRRNREEIGARATWKTAGFYFSRGLAARSRALRARISRLRRSCAQLDKTAMLRRLYLCLKATRRTR